MTVKALSRTRRRLPTIGSLNSRSTVNALPSWSPGTSKVAVSAVPGEFALCTADDITLDSSAASLPPSVTSLPTALFATADGPLGSSATSLPSNASSAPSNTNSPASSGISPRNAAVDPADAGVGAEPTALVVDGDRTGLGAVGLTVSSSEQPIIAPAAITTAGTTSAKYLCRSRKVIPFLLLRGPCGRSHCSLPQAGSSRPLAASTRPKKPPADTERDRKHTTTATD